MWKKILNHYYKLISRNNLSLIIYFLFLKLILACKVYDYHYQCSSNSESAETWNKRCFQTPKKGGTDDPKYRDSYQDMHYIVGYVKLKYSQDKQLCNISVYTKINEYDTSLNMTNHELLYTYGEIEQKNNYFILTKDNDTFPNGLNVSVRIANKVSNETFAKLEFEEEYFVWNVPKFLS